MSELTKINFQNLALSESSYDEAVFNKLRVDCENEKTGNLTGVDCPICKNRGKIWINREGDKPFPQDCKCMPMRRCVWRMEDSGLKDVIRSLTFEKFRAEEPWQQAILASAKDYAQNPDGWFLLCGQSGSGKSHLCTAICRELLLKEKQVVYASWRKEIGEIKGMSLDNPKRGARMDELKNAQILYLDDLFKCGADANGVVRPTSADISLTIEILNDRYMGRKPTLISTEFTPDQLLKLDESVGGRILEMAGAHAMTIGKDTRRNYRLRGMKIL